MRGYFVESKGDIHSAALAKSTSGIAVAKVANCLIRVLSMQLICDAALTLTWKNDDGSGTVVNGAQAFPANGGIVLPHNPVGWFQTTVANKDLYLVISGTGNVGGSITYQFINTAAPGYDA